MSIHQYAVKSNINPVHEEKLDKRIIRTISILVFFIGLAQSVLIYVTSSYFQNASGSGNVGIFFLTAYFFELIILFNLHKIIIRLGQARTFLLSVFVKIPFLTILTFLDPSVPGILTLMGYIVFGNISWVILDMILEACSVDRMSGRIRGRHLTVLNAGFILGPLISSQIMEKYGFSGIFLIALFLYSVIFSIALISLRDFRGHVLQRSKVLKIFQKISGRKNLQRIYLVSLVLEFFYALMIIFMPLHLLELGISWQHIGLIFMFMLLPFILLQYPVGYLADKEMGEKEMIILSLFIISISSSALYFINSSSALVWAIMLFLTRIGAASLEILRDSYFYKRIDCRDIDLIDFFRTTRPAAYISVAILSTFFIFLFPLKTVFLLAGFVSLTGIIPAWKLVDNLSEREINENSLL